MFPEDFFGTPNQYKTIQTQINKNREHPKIINPLLFKNKTNQPYIDEIKEEKCEESIMEMSKNKNSLKIIIPHNISNEEISTSGGSYNTPVTPNIPIKPVIYTEPNKNSRKECRIKDKILSNNINSSLNKKNIVNNAIDDNIDLCYPMAFTFNFKEKKNQTIKNNNRCGGNKYNSFERNKKIIKENKKRDYSAQNKKREKIKKENKYERNNSYKNNNKKEDNNSCKKNNKYLNISYNKNSSYDQNKNENEYKRNINKNNSKREIKKNSKISSYDRKSKSAKKGKETINIITIKTNVKNNIKTNVNLLKKNSKDDKKDLYNRNNLHSFKLQYEKKKKEIVQSKVEKDINHIFKKLPENYEKLPEINNKMELFMKNIDEIKYVLNKKKQKI